MIMSDDDDDNDNEKRRRNNSKKGHCKYDYDSSRDNDWFTCDPIPVPIC